MVTLWRRRRRCGSGGGSVVVREKDRERAQIRTGGKAKGKDDGLTPEQRRERDGKALQEKAAKKAEKATGSGDAGDSVLGFLQSVHSSLPNIQIATDAFIASTKHAIVVILDPGMRKMQDVTVRQEHFIIRFLLPKGERWNA
ncbi:hypothetical protein C3L33_15177, partial [Rhododendron williamsianum]